jgi:SAM-dependent methyltransferase
MEQEFGQFGALAPFYDELMQSVPYSDWVDYVQLLWQLHDCEPSSVLDAACGTGNVSFELARRGYEVWGVDLSQAMVDFAREKQEGIGTGAASVSEFRQGDMRRLELGRAFDAATCLYDSLNYILEPEGLRQAFEGVARHVRPGGLWVFDMNAEWAFEADLFTQSSRDPRRDLHYSWQASFDRQTRICTVQMEFKKTLGTSSEQTFRETHKERAYALDEVLALLARTPWRLEKAYDAYTLNRPHGRSERWYFVARRL